jgi:hypothetical protein
VDIVLFPHCDLHVALNGTPPLRIRIMRRELAADEMSYELSPPIFIPPIPAIEFDFLAPYNPVPPAPGPNRLQRFVRIEPDGTVTPLAVGTNLVQARMGEFYIIFRIQVHDRILGWWFGTTSMTVPLDRVIFHSQPSIYALFSDDPSGTDLVGDITGHGYVTLTPNNPARFVVNADGRLRGVSEGEDGILNGTFLGVPNSIPIKVVDYAKTRKKLEYVQIPDVEHPQDMHNLLFVSEGFRDKDKFDEVVKEVVEEMFDKPRHSPYNLLEDRFNIWKVYEPSTQVGLTVGYRVNDEDLVGPIKKGYIIPFERELPDNKGMFTVRELVQRVGLPGRNETRSTADLITLWSSQSLTDFHPNRVNENVVTAWKRSKSVGILEARDTFFGFILGSRNADRRSVEVRLADIISEPASDTPALMGPFINRLYEWFQTADQRSISPDPRRHPPELQDDGQTNAGSSVLRYIGGLRVPFNTPEVSQEWLPNVPPPPTQPPPAQPRVVLKRSRGLIAIIANENLTGGTNLNNNTLTISSVGEDLSVAFAYVNQGNERVMKRNLPPSIEPDTDAVINTVTHELGHSFALGDEYEDVGGDDPSAALAPGEDLPEDNLTRIGAIFFDQNFMTNRKIELAKVKWFGLARFRLSDVLIKDSEIVSGQIKVTIDKRFIGKWLAASKKPGNLAGLRRIAFAPTKAATGPDIPATFTPEGSQLPINSNRDHLLSGLTIANVKEADGTILLSVPPSPSALPNFPVGSLVFIPRLVSPTQVDVIVEKEVVIHMSQKQLPLNKNTDVSAVNDEEDEPVDISGIKAPCKAYRLVGIYEGAFHHSGLLYRPTGLCKMRKATEEGTGDGEFCFVCKYLIVNRVGPHLHDLLDKLHYPSARR